MAAETETLSGSAQAPGLQTVVAPSVSYRMYLRQVHLDLDNTSSRNATIYLQDSRGRHFQHTVRRRTSGSFPISLPPRLFLISASLSVGTDASRGEIHWTLVIDREKR